MDLRKSLLAEHSKAQCLKVVNWVGTSQPRFDELFALFLSHEYRVVQRSAWPLSYAVIAHPELIRPHFSKLIRYLAKPGIHPAVKRNAMRLLQGIEIPRRFQGKIMSLCFGYVSDPNEAIATKAFSLTVLENLAAHYPEILPELKTIIEDRWEFETPAFRSRGKKILKKASIPSRK